MRAKAKELTRREFEMADLTVWGCSADEIADRLKVSVHTVRNTMRNIYEKLGLNKSNELAAYIFYTRYGVDADQNKVGNIRRAIGSIALFAILMIHITNSSDQMWARRMRGRRSAKRNRNGYLNKIQ